MRVIALPECDFDHVIHLLFRVIGGGPFSSLIETKKLEMKVLAIRILAFLVANVHKTEILDNWVTEFTIIFSNFLSAQTLTPGKIMNEGYMTIKDTATAIKILDERWGLQQEIFVQTFPSCRVTKVIAQVSSHMDPDEEESLLMLQTLPELPEEATPEVLLQSDELPVKIIPYIGHRPLKIDPDIISDHLAVLSIKTEPLEKTCLSRIGISLTELRRASASGKSITRDLGIQEVADVQQRKERRPSLDMAVFCVLVLVLYDNVWERGWPK